MNFEFFLSLKFKVLNFFRFKLCEIGFFVLSSTSMPIFISFEPRLLSQLSEKREKGEKQCKTAVRVKTNSFDSWGDSMPDFSVEGR